MIESTHDAKVVCTYFEVYKKKGNKKKVGRTFPRVSFLLSLDHGVDGSLEDILAVQKLELDQEDELEDVASELLDQLLGTSSASTGGNQVVNDNDVLTGLDGVLLHLKDILKGVS